MMDIDDDNPWISMNNAIVNGMQAPSLEIRSSVRQAILKGDINGAISMINEYDSTILDTNPRLYFQLQVFNESYRIC